MREYRSVILLILIMTGVTLVVGGAAILILYETAMTQARMRLTEAVRSQAVLIDAIVGHEISLGEPVSAAQRNAIVQIGMAYAAGGAASAVGDLNLARREGDEIVFLVRSDQPDGKPLRVGFDAPGVEPMRRALSGENGVLTNVAYLGRQVMAAYEPVPTGDLGVVSKIDLAALRAPFKRAAFAVLALALVMISLGTTLFVHISAPIIEHLRTSERRFRDLFASMSSGVAVFRAVGDGSDFVFTDLNPAGERIDQMSRASLLGHAVGEVLPGTEASGLLDVLRRVWLTGKAEHLPPRLYEDQRIRGWRESIVYKLPGGEVVELFDDVTQRQATEEQLRHAQKMEVVGQLTGGVAHDFNNLLAIILGNLQLLRERLGDDSVARELVADALWSAERGAELTHRLLAFARRQPLNPVVTDVNALIQGMIELVRRTVASSSLGNPAVSRRGEPRAGAMAGHHRPRPARKRADEPHRQCPRRDGLGRHIDACDRQRRGRGNEGRARGERRDHARRLHHRRGERHRGRHPRRRHRPHLRAVLHHQASRRGQRPRPEHGLWLRQAVGRARGGRQQARPRHHRPPVPAAGGGRGGGAVAAQAAAIPAGAAAGG